VLPRVPFVTRSRDCSGSDKPNWADAWSRRTSSIPCSVRDELYGPGGRSHRQWEAQRRGGSSEHPGSR